MRAITFKYGSRESGWKYYSCTDKETKWDKERASLWGLEGNMTHWTYPKEDINVDRKKQIELENVPMGMDYVKCNYNKLLKKLKNITRNMQEENFQVDLEETTFYWELSIENCEVSNCATGIGTRHIKSLKMFRGTNYEPEGLQEIKKCFANYFSNK